MLRLQTRFLVLILMLTVKTAMAVDAAKLMTDLTWEKRVLLLFSPDENHAGLRLQRAQLESVKAGLVERDLAVIKVFSTGLVEIDGAGYVDSAAGFQRRFTVGEDEFRVILVGKDGGVKLDLDTTVSIDDLFALIDSMPMRQYEMLSNG